MLEVLNKASEMLSAMRREGSKMFDDSVRLP